MNLDLIKSQQWRIEVKDYDGWAMRVTGQIIPWSFRERRSEVVDWWDNAVTVKKWPWDRFRKTKEGQNYKIIKVKLIEVK